VSVVFCQVEASASGRSLVQRSSTECGVSECDRESSIIWTLWPTMGLLRHGKKNASLMMNPRGGNIYLYEYFIFKSCVSMVIYLFPNMF
jgi:hypothetical protein